MISIVIPAYNAERYLGECLDSVLAQTYQDWEAIVVDDGSTDSTGVIAGKYAKRDERIKVYSKKNGGLSDARNYGLEQSIGDWILYLDSDDCLYPHALDALWGGVSDEVSIVIGGFVNGDTYTPCDCKGDVSFAISDARAIFVRMLYQRGVNNSAWGKLFKRESLNGLRFKKGLWYEDLEFSGRYYVTIGKVSVIDVKVYFYRNNHASFLNNFGESRLHVLEVTRQIENYYENDAELLAAARDRRLSANFNIFGLLAVNDHDGRYSQVADGCWDVIKSHRSDSLFNPHVRIKNKLGILASYLGRGALAALSRMIYH